MIFCRRFIIATLCIVALAGAPPSVSYGTDLTADIDLAMSQRDFVTAVALLDEHLVEQPDDDSKRFKRAQVLGWMGEYSLARDGFDGLVKKHPDNVDYVFGRARILGLQGNDAEALTELRRARALAPDYEAIWQLQFQLLSRQKSADAKLKLNALYLEAEQKFPQAGWLVKPRDQTRSDWTILAGLTFEQLSRDLPGWNRQFLEVSSDSGDRVRYFFRASRYERFDRSDSTIGGGADWQLTRNWLAGFDANISPDASFQANNEYSLHAGRKFAKNWLADLRYRRRNYDTATVDFYVATTEYYFGNFRAAYTLGLADLRGAKVSAGHTITLNWYRNDRTAFGVSLSSGNEAEAIDAGQVLVTSVRGIALTGRHALNDRIGLHGWLGIHEQGDFYRRQYAGMAVSIRL